MKKLALLAAFLLIFGLALGVAETEKPLSLSGSVEFSIGDDDIKEDPGSAFSAANTGVIATLQVGSESDMVEAGVTINLVPAVTRTDAVDADPEDVQDFLYDAIQAALDWYYYQMVQVAADFTQDDGTTMAAEWADVALPAGTIGAADTAAGDLIDDDTAVGPWTVADNPEDATLINEVQDLYEEVRDYVFSQIALLNAIYKSSDYDPVLLPPAGPGQEYIDAEWTGDVLSSAQAESDMYDDAYEHVFGEDTDDTFAAAFPITNAYLKIKGIAGVVDIMAELMGRAVGVGSMVTSAYNGTSGNDANYGFTVALSEGVVPGVSFSALVTGSDADMAAAVDQDYETEEYTVEDAEEPVWGGQIDVGYATDMFGADVQFGVVDLKADDFVWIASVMPFVSMPDMFGLSVKGEFDVVGAEDMGIAAAASVGAAYMGIAPNVTFWWKNEFFGGDDTTNAATGADDITDDSGLAAQFGSVDLEAATALAIALSVDLADLLGMKLITLSGGYDMLLAPQVDDKSESGYNLGVALDFAEVLGMPVTLGFNMSQWGIQREADDKEDLVWSGVLGYTYDALAVSFTLKQTEEDVIGWALAGKVSF